MTGASRSSPIASRSGLRARQERLPHAPEAERLLVDHLIPERMERVLDLGTGEGHLLAAIVAERPGVEAIGLDISPSMVAAAGKRFGDDSRVGFEVHDLMEPLPHRWEGFDLVVSALAIHHLPDERKRSLCQRGPRPAPPRRSVLQPRLRRLALR